MLPFIANYPIFTRFCMHVHLITTHLKNEKQRQRKKYKMSAAAIFEKYLNEYNAVNYEPMLMNCETYAHFFIFYLSLVNQTSKVKSKIATDVILNFTKNLKCLVLSFSIAIKCQKFFATVKLSPTEKNDQFIIN